MKKNQIKRPNINLLLNKDLFFKHYEVLTHALSTNRMFSRKFFINRIESKVPKVKKKKKQSQKLNIEPIESVIPDKANPAEDLDLLLKNYCNKAAKTTKNFYQYYNDNKNFLSGYKLLHRNQSERKMNPTLFKTNPLLVKSQSDLNLLFLGKGEKIEPSELKYIKSLNNYNDYIEYISLLRNNDNDVNDVKVRTSKYVTNYPVLKAKEEEEKREKEEKENQKGIEENTKNIEITNDTLIKLKENPNFFEDKNTTVSKKTNTYKTFINCESEIASISSSSLNKNKKKMNSTSSTGFYSPNSTYRNSFNHNSHNFSISQSPAQEINRKKYNRKSVSYHSLDLLSFDSFSTTNYGAKKVDFDKIENMYNKLRKCANLNESNKVVERGFTKDVINNFTNKNKSQIYNLMLETKKHAKALNVRKEVIKIYNSKIPYKTGVKLRELEEIEDTFSKFDFKFFKSIIGSKIK